VLFFQRYKARLSLKLKVIISLCLVLSTVFIVSGYITYKLHVQIAKDEVSEQFTQTVDQIMYSIDQRAQMSYKLSNQIIFHPMLVELLQKTAVNYYDTLSIQNVLDQMMLSESQLLSINLFNIKGNQFRPANSFLFRPLHEAAYTEIMNKLHETDGELIWYKTSFDRLLTNSKLDSEAIIAARLMKTDRLETYGILVFVFNERYFLNELQSVMKNADGSMYLFNGSKELLYTDDTSYSMMPLPDEGFEVTDRSSIYAESRSELTGFTLISRTSFAKLKVKSQIIFSIALFSGIASIILSSVLVMIAMQRLFKPLSGLVKGMRKVRNGDLDTRIEIQTSDELAFLGESFNDMLRNINLLIKEVYEKQLREREAELKALQAQLNPHFLYNTLDMIYWKLYLQDDHDNAKLIISLSEMLRYSLEPVNKDTTVKDELNQLNNYLSIQSSRFEDTLVCNQDIAQEALNSRIVPLLLQPLVENVFIHAFRNISDQRGLLTIKVFIDHSVLVIEITDNGSGIAQDRIEQLLKSTDVHDQEAHLGIRSVVRRIALIYGEPYRLEIESELGRGTTMRLLLPYVDESSSSSREGQI
jgi:two-component system sensor histidine kinase YesM